jgi:hypothetical protein
MPAIGQELTFLHAPAAQAAKFPDAETNSGTWPHGLCVLTGSSPQTMERIRVGGLWVSPALSVLPQPVHAPATRVGLGPAA